MVSRADVVDILIRRNVPEAKAWEIVFAMEPEYFEAMNKATIWRETDELLYSYIKQKQDAA